MTLFTAPYQVTATWTPGTYKFNIAYVRPDDNRDTNDPNDLIILRPVTRHAE